MLKVAKTFLIKKKNPIKTRYDKKKNSIKHWVLWSCVIDIKYHEYENSDRKKLYRLACNNT